MMSLIKLHNYDEIVKQAKACQKNWGMGFPVISITLLEPFLLDIQNELENRERQIMELQEEIGRLRGYDPK